MKDIIKRLLVEEDGQGIVEYALILGLVVFGIWVLIKNTGIQESVQSLFSGIKTELDNCKSGSCGGGSSSPTP